MREQKNWRKKSAKNSYHDKTTLKQNIAQKMLFKMRKGDFSHRKMFVFSY